MARTSEARNPSLAGNSREGKISFLIQAGLKNDAIMAALEAEYPEYIPGDDQRRIDRKKNKKLPAWPAFDKIARQRAQEAIRSTRKQDSDKEADLTHLIEVGGGENEVRPLAESKLENLKRFQTGYPIFDHIYGHTDFVHLSDHPDLLWLKGDPMIPDGHSKFVKTRIITNDWETVIEKRGEAPVKRRVTILDPNLDLKRQLRQNGMPEGFLSIWGGAPGVGKSRLALSLARTLTKQFRIQAKLDGLEPRPVLYLNGEAPESQFRLWCGSDIDPELFLAYHTLATGKAVAPLVRLESIVTMIERYQPRVVITDSLQMIAEVKKGHRAAEGVMARFNQVKSDPKYGHPHFILISQLNQKEQIAGSRQFQYLADFIAVVTRWQQEGTFLFDCPEKNRGGATPRGGIFRHTANGPECISTERKGSSGVIKLIQPMTPVLVNPMAELGVAAPEDMEQEQGDVE